MMILNIFLARRIKIQSFYPNTIVLYFLVIFVLFFVLMYILYNIWYYNTIIESWINTHKNKINFFCVKGSTESLAQSDGDISVPKFNNIYQKDAFLIFRYRNKAASKDFMEQQQHGFSDSTPRAGSDRLQKSAKSLLSALQLMSISQISTQKYGSGNSEPI